MKKTVKNPDGTESVIEGTAEEIAEYERQLHERSVGTGKKNENAGKGRRLLTEEDIRALTDAMKEAVKLMPAPIVITQYPQLNPIYPIYPTYRYVDDFQWVPFVSDRVTCTDITYRPEQVRYRMDTASA